jgi:ankyrin repeat protein
VVRSVATLFLAVASSQFAACKGSDEGPPVPLRPHGVCNQELTDAVRLGRAAQVRTLIARHAQVNCIEPVSGADRVRPWTTPLELAVATGQPDVVRLVIAAGAKPADEELEIPAIYRAVRLRRLDLVRILLESGASADSRSGSPILREAVLQSDVGIVSALLERGADPNQRWFSDLQPGGNVYDPATLRECGITALMEVAGRGATVLVAPLLRAGADELQVDCKGRTALEYARERNHEAIVEILSR